jgi:CS domain
MLIIKDFKWTQTLDEIYIHVPVKGSLRDVDIVTHENFIKIHAAPYYFEVFLLHNINEDMSCCRLTKDRVEFTLKKIEFLEWEKLERDFVDKEEKLRVKSVILQEIQALEREKLKQKIEIKQKTKRSEVENSITKLSEVC